MDYWRGNKVGLVRMVTNFGIGIDKDIHTKKRPRESLRTVFNMKKITNKSNSLRGYLLPHKVFVFKVLC